MMNQDVWEVETAFMFPNMHMWAHHAHGLPNGLQILAVCQSTTCVCEVLVVCKAPIRHKSEYWFSAKVNKLGQQPWKQPDIGDRYYHANTYD